MTTTLHAQPYDLAASGFYFEDAQTFATKSAALRNDYDPKPVFPTWRAKTERCGS